MSNDGIHITYPDSNEEHEQDFLESVLDKDELNCETPAENQVTQTTKRLRKQERK